MNKNNTYHKEIQELVLSGYNGAIYLLLMALKENPSAEGDELIRLAKQIAETEPEYNEDRSIQEPKPVSYIESNYKFDEAFIKEFEKTSKNSEINEKYDKKSSTDILSNKEILSNYGKHFFFSPPRIRKPFIDINFKNGLSSDGNSHFNILDSVSDMPCTYEEPQIVKNLFLDIDLIKKEISSLYPTATRGINYISKESLIQQIDDYLNGITPIAEPIKKTYSLQDLTSLESLINIVPIKEEVKADIETLIESDEEDSIEVKLDITDLEYPEATALKVEEDNKKPKKRGFWARLFGKKAVEEIEIIEEDNSNIKQVYQIDDIELAEIKSKPRETKNFEVEVISEVEETELLDDNLFQVIQEPAEFIIKPKSYYEEIQLVEALESLDAITIDPNLKPAEDEPIEEESMIGVVETVDYDPEKELEEKTIGGNISLNLGTKEYTPQSEKIAGVQDLSPNIIDLTNLGKTKRKWWVFSKKQKTKDEVLQEVLKPAVAPVREVALPEDAKEIFFPNKSNYMISEGLKLSLDDEEIKIDLSDTSNDRKIESDFIKEAIVINPEEAQKNKNQYDFIEPSDSEELSAKEESLDLQLQEDNLDSFSGEDSSSNEDAGAIEEPKPLLPPRPEINSRQLIRDISIIDTEN